MKKNISQTTSTENIWTIYKPLILIAIFIIGLTALIEIKAGEFVVMRAMDNFMAGFFIFFAFFKFLNLKGFADAFATYDVVAKHSRVYALAYPFIELALGVSFILGVFPLAANVLVVVLMVVGNYGIWKVLKRKGTLQCACIGTIFNLPMSKITLFENTLMMFMALVSLSLH